MRYFTSDTHFDHKNLIEKLYRPEFTSVDEMNAELIRRWNARVKPDDEVFHLGDFSFGKPSRWEEVRAALAGKLTLIVGNHDSRKSARRAGFDAIVEGGLSLRYGAAWVYLRHVPWPLEIDDRDNTGVAAPRGHELHLAGHVHSRWKAIGNVVNVGVDVWDFAPVTIEEARAASIRAIEAT